MASPGSSSAKPGTWAAKKQAADEKRALIKKAQENVFESLPPNHLFILLFFLTPPDENRFHWGFYHHRDANTGGTKYHVKNLGDGWLTDHGATKGALKSMFLCVVVAIAAIPAARAAELEATMRTFDHGLNDVPGVTCRVWLFRVLELLLQTGFVRCDPDTAALEAECKAFGNQHLTSALQNEQPRPVVVSRVASSPDGGPLLSG